MNDHNETHIERWRRTFTAAAGGRSELVAYTSVWPLAYVAAASPQRAVVDAEALNRLDSPAPHVALTQGSDGPPRITIAVAGRQLALGEVLPGLQSLGLEVLSEQPFTLTRPDGVDCWLYDFVLEPTPGGFDDASSRRVEDAFRALWTGEIETDPFNRLVTIAQLSWRDAAVMRAYGQYLHQLRSPWGRTYTATVLAEHAQVTQRLRDLFVMRFAPGRGGPDNEAEQRRLHDEIEAAVDDVENLTADRVLRSYLDLIMATVRTNVFASGQGSASRAMALKFDPRGIDAMPQPRPRFEVFVSSPRLEGIHLRFGPVARGGLRWSDRHEDLRTEILGLATAQVAKNAVIVPTGAKGGFVIKRPPGRAAHAAADGLPRYREFISALLDVHDNLDSATGEPVRASGSVAYDGGDAYLVVAADKGTATFSDTANEIASGRGFWLGDAFASGGSAGYDHKSMGITAKGAWCSVRRHFAELGVDVDTDEVTAVGIGDMSGDVFGNGMLLSRSLKLVAAFDHRHVFLDPDPDPAVAHAERSRLFDLPRSSWADYDPTLISRGGGVFPRTAKSVTVSDEVREALAISEETSDVTPSELIRAVLAAPVDLLWNGGVGTYVKASTEHHSDAGDKTNDVVRIDATQLRARVVAEGGNLGLTQRARVEFATAGGKMNTDALDNSAGVGCSDREVNIKIALQRLVGAGLPAADRLALLGMMTDEVAELVLTENVKQNDMLGLCRQYADEDLGLHARLIDDLERRRGLDREQWALPSSAEVERRHRAGRGLERPEMAVLTAQVKLDVRETLLAGAVPDLPAVAHFLSDYFPTQLQRHREAIDDHPLRREIVATELVNTLVDNVGMGWVQRMLENTTATVEDVTRAYLVASTVFDLPSLWQRVRDDDVATEVSGALIWESIRVLDRASRWLLQHRPQPLDVSREIERFSPTVATLSSSVPGWHEGRDHVDYVDRLEPIVAAGADPALAATIFDLLERFCLLDVTEITHDTGQPLSRVAPLYYLVKERRKIDRLLTRVSGLSRDDRWSALARLGVRDDLYESVRAIVTTILSTTSAATDPIDALHAWENRVGGRLATIESVVEASHVGHDLANLAVAARQIRTLALLTAQQGEDVTSSAA